MIIYLFRKALWVSAFGLFLLAYAVLVEPAQLKIRQVEFLSNKYSGPDIRIGVITDIHIGGMHVPPKRVKSLVKEMNALNPDLVLLPGDFVGTHLSYQEETEAFNDAIEEGMAYLSGLTAPAFATLGNHDTLYDKEIMIGILEPLNLTLLENKATTFKGLCLVGISDFKTSVPDRAAYDACGEGEPPIVFTHSPDAWQSFRSDSVLVVAGHTHGGQVNLPIIGRRVNSISLGREHSYGFSKIAGVDMFVSAGVGTSILPIRFRAPPEIVIITLRAQKK